MSATYELSCRMVDAIEIPQWFLDDDNITKQIGASLSWSKTRVVLIDSHSTCGPAGRQTFEGVALVFCLWLGTGWHPNPAVCFRNPTTIGLSERIIEFVKTRPWED